jgi:hypothetical protein
MECLPPADKRYGMARMATSVESTAAAPPELAGCQRYVARQPILDLHGRVHGYELLFRSGSGAL